MKSLGLLRLHHVKTKGISSIFRVFFVVYSQFLKVIDSFMVEGFLLCWFFDSSTFSSFFRLFRFFFERWPETIAVLRRADFRCVADFFLFFSFFCFFFGLFSSLGFSSGRARVPRRKSPRIKEDLVASLTKFRRVTIVKKKSIRSKKKGSSARHSIDWYQIRRGPCTNKKAAKKNTQKFTSDFILRSECDRVANQIPHTTATGFFCFFLADFFLRQPDLYPPFYDGEYNYNAQPKREKKKMDLLSEPDPA